MAHENIKWTETLPAVLLGLRVAVKPDINASSAELVYGVSLRLPAEICTDTSSMPLDYGFVQQLKNHMNHLKPLSTSTHGFSKIFVHPKLDDCSHVFLRVDKVSPSLSQPYTGPHEVLSRNDKHITININGKKSCVSLDRVKPAFVFKDLPDTIPDPIISAESSHRHPVTTNMQTTKSGRRDPLRKILGRALLTFEELSMILSEVEVIVNHRPLTYVENDPGEPEPLTPAHFLELGYGDSKYPIYFIELIDATTAKESYKKRKTYRTLLLKQLWRRWSICSS
ncbi:integrase catalytic domain-containing protein [Trichonephila clavipes]|uniref:Integrase catalytic domain-containing protein n=1 Tax=Trichonephila clavipes TaxID=2585209 RepID=A0A8X6WHH6_TRICX|nr:integrase catalytic domain-containing protein [Trichonephila clavipes]